MNLVADDVDLEVAVFGYKDPGMIISGTYKAEVLRCLNLLRSMNALDEELVLGFKASVQRMRERALGEGDMMGKKYRPLQESKGKGKRIEELVKGSLDYARYEIEQAFRAQFPEQDGQYYWLAEVFEDHVIVSQNSYGEHGQAEQGLKADEYFTVSFTRQGETITFQPREQWAVVELTYQPQAMTESVWMLESAGENGARKIRINKLMTAGEINGNKRRYPAPVLQAAVEELRTHLHESAGQGRLMLLGEVEHPTQKSGRANLMETVIRWTEVTFDGRDVNVSGLLATETEGGRQIQALAAIGVVPGGSIRGYGLSEAVKVGSEQVEEVSELHITGIDVVTEASFSNSQTILESRVDETLAEDNRMNKLQILQALLKARPDLFKGVSEATLNAMTEGQIEALYTKVNEAMGIDLSQIKVDEGLKEMASKARAFDEGQKKATVETAIAEATKELPYGEEGNKAFVEAIHAANPQDATAVKSLVEAKRKEYDKLFAGRKLEARGFTGQITGMKDVLEAETGTPEFGRVAFEISESMRKHEMRARKDLRKDESRAGIFTQQLLERFDKLYFHKLMAEAKSFQEAETASDLNIPYSVSRAIIAEAFPNLVAANVFDVGLMQNSPERIYYEAFAGETGYTVAITDEVVTGGAEETWYDLDFKRVVPGTAVVTSNPAGTTWVEGTDYVIDYELGKIKFLTAGGINADDVLVDYTYNAIRLGENVEIERAKVTLSYQTIEAAADRLADYITSEAIVFSRSQLGFDAVARTMANIVRQTRLNIEKGLIEKALGAALGLANNSGGTWTAATDPWAELVEKLGYAKVKVANRYYEPTAILMSPTNADYLSNWDGFTTAGFPNAVLSAAGFAGGVKGLPIFASTQMRDGWALVMNREIVMHRVFQPMTIKGPFQTFGAAYKLVAAEQYYAEEYNASLAPIAGKASYVKIV
jgi:hypothetical protein